MRQALFTTAELPEEIPSPQKLLQAIVDAAAAASVGTTYDWLFARDAVDIRARLAERRDRPRIVLCFEGWADPLHEMQGVGVWLFSASVQFPANSETADDANEPPWATALETAAELERFLRSIRFRSSLVRPEGFRAKASWVVADEAGTALGYRLSFDLPVAPPANREVTIDLSAFMAASTTNQ